MPASDDRTLFKKFVITDISQTQAYLVRWSLRLPFGASIKLHAILRPDSDRCAHDHPWPFLRIILAGGYTEEYGEDHRIAHRKPWRPWAPWRLYYCPANFRHRITTLTRGKSWSLVICGPRFREWGFFTREGWMPWRKFVDAARTDRVMWCDDGSALSQKGIQ